MKTNFYLLATYVQEIQLLAITPHLNAIVGNGSWNFDIEDCDKVLRLNCNYSTKEKVMRFLIRNKLFDREIQYIKNEQHAHIGNVQPLSAIYL
ncbi:hypothetical protein [Aquimarina litoralis]|uniref:hypothetical protein n=1 Tax=Aquimarina litoralis TaxID=584605 RepID=UPI001C598432|nr:hypothetical protein [Aquimarina litoralis]MBW1298576.1 hypothetical protein [Aquimarina litoralis]